MMSIIGFLLSPLGRILAGVSAVGLFVFAFALDQRSRGAEKAVARIEKATQHAVSKADRAGRRSRTGSGVRDPYTDPD